ncbi:PRC-barrel domain-containing protein [Aegicerativicinus sediminis]
MENSSKHLYYLTDLKDYKISDGYTDVRGWPVRDRDNRVIGKVDNLLVNVSSERVVYLDVEVDDSIIEKNYDPYRSSTSEEIREFINRDGETHVILPIGLVDIHSSDKYVFTDTLDRTAFAQTKRFTAGSNIQRDYEIAVLDGYGRTLSTKTVESSETTPNKIEVVIKTEPSKVNVENKERKFNRNRDISDAEIIVDEEPIIEKRHDTYFRERDSKREDGDFYRRAYFDDRRFRK